MLGEVFVPTLRPYFSSGFGSVDNPQKFTIWGPWVKAPPGADRAGYGRGGAQHTGAEGMRSFIGDMYASIKWIPAVEHADAGRQDIGQLGIHLYWIQFEPARIEAARNKNPWVTVCSYDAKGQ